MVNKNKKGKQSSNKNAKTEIIMTKKNMNQKSNRQKLKK